MTVQPATGQPATGQQGPVGMVGVGNMGGRITRRMTGAGHRVLAVDADASRMPRGSAPSDRVFGLAYRGEDKKASAAAWIVLVSRSRSGMIFPVIAPQHRIGRAARCLPGRSFSARPSAEPRGHLSVHVALQ